MIVTNRKLGLLAVVAAALLSLALGLYWTGHGKTQKFQKGTPLIQGLDVESITTVALKAADGAVTLKRTLDGFVVAERSGYPADTKKVNELVLKCLDIKCSAVITDNPENFDELGVGKKPDTASVRFADADNNTLVELIVGKSPERGGGPYVRLASQNTVYAAESYVWFSDRPNGYIQTEIVNVAKDKTASVSVDLADEAYTLRMGDDGNAEFDGKVPEGKRVKQSELNAAFTAMSYLSFDGVKPGDDNEVRGLNWKVTYTCNLTNGMAYVAQIAEKDSKHYMRIVAKRPSEGAIRQNVPTGEESPEALARKDAVIRVVQQADEFNRKHVCRITENGSGIPWVYVIPEWKAKALTKPLDELMEDIPKPAEAPATEAPETEPAPTD